MTSTASDEIVAFSSPPVVEVVAGVAFDALDTEVNALLTAFWKDKLRQEFPTLQQQPPYFPPIEHALPRAALNLAGDFGSAFPSARLWAISPDGNELLQLQPGWFAANWRRVKLDSEYDRWPQRRRAFANWCTALAEYLESEGGKDFPVRQCEVTYVNHIDLAGEKRVHAQASRIFKGLADLEAVSGLEQVALQSSYLMRDRESNRAFGRLHIGIKRCLVRTGSLSATCSNDCTRHASESR